MRYSLLVSGLPVVDFQRLSGSERQMVYPITCQVFFENALFRWFCLVNHLVCKAILWTNEWLNLHFQWSLRCFDDHWNSICDLPDQSMIMQCITACEEASSKSKSWCYIEDQYHTVVDELQLDQRGSVNLKVLLLALY